MKALNAEREKAGKKPIPVATGGRVPGGLRPARPGQRRRAAGDRGGQPQGGVLGPGLPQDQGARGSGDPHRQPGRLGDPQEQPAAARSRSTPSRRRSQGNAAGQHDAQALPEQHELDRRTPWRAEDQKRFDQTAETDQALRRGVRLRLADDRRPGLPGIRIRSEQAQRGRRHRHHAAAAQHRRRQGGGHPRHLHRRRTTSTPG